FNFFNQYTALLYGLFSGLMLVLFFKNWLINNFITLWPMGFFTFCIVFEFAYMLFDQVHLKHDWYFLLWAVLLGGVAVAAISILIVLKKITLRKTLPKALYISAIFLFSTVYSYGLLSFINIFNA